MHLVLAFFALLLALVAAPGHTAVVDGATFDDSTKVAAKTLPLNGIGWRKAFLGIRVYAAALYLEEKNTDADAVLASKGPKRLEMQFHRDVDQETTRDKWLEAFKNNCNANCDDLRPALDKLVASMGAVKEGDRIALLFDDKGVTLFRSGKEVTTVGPAQLGAQLLRNWLGPKPPSDSLKEGLLGLHK